MIILKVANHIGAFSGAFPGTFPCAFLVHVQCACIVNTSLFCAIKIVLSVCHTVPDVHRYKVKVQEIDVAIFRLSTRRTLLPFCAVLASTPTFM